MLWRSLFLFIVATHVRRAKKTTEDREEVKLMLEQPANPTNHDQPTGSGDLVEGQGMEKDPLTLGLHTCHSHRRWPFHCPAVRTWHGPRRRGSERLDDYSSEGPCGCFQK